MKAFSYKRHLSDNIAVLVMLHSLRSIGDGCADTPRLSKVAALLAEPQEARIM